MDSNIQYDRFKPWLTLDDWQKEVLKTKGNIVVRSGRQTGKSTVISIYTGDYACLNERKEVLVVAAVERQAYLLFEKILAYILDRYPKYIKQGKDRPTKSVIKLKNGSIIRCLPTGLTGYGIRGFTTDLLIADEAAYIPEAVWTAITPQMAITEGKMILLSTPKGRQGYFYRCFSDETFKEFHISAEDCPRKNVAFLENEKKTKSKLQYAQEYLGEFLDELRQFFPTDLIRKCMVLEKRDKILEQKKYYLGVDVARMGEDESTFEIIDGTKDNLKQVENILTKHNLITETAQKIINLHKKYKFKQIYIDDGGMGVGVYDILLGSSDTKKVVKSVYSLARPLDHKEKQSRKVIKEEMYTHLLTLMEQGKIKLLDDPEILLSMSSVQYEYQDGGKMKIFGENRHIVDGIKLAAWGSKDKSLNIYFYS